MTHGGKTITDTQGLCNAICRKSLTPHLTPRRHTLIGALIPPNWGNQNISSELRQNRNRYLTGLYRRSVATHTLSDTSNVYHHIGISLPPHLGKSTYWAP